jgi:hypothetical protein
MESKGRAPLDHAANDFPSRGIFYLASYNEKLRPARSYLTGIIIFAQKQE